MHLSQIRSLSTVQRGTAFEYRALALLTKYMSMSLTRVGGSNDGGVDLIGWWWVPSKDHTTTTHDDALDATVAPTMSMSGCTISNRRRLRVLAQCKAEKRKMGPAYLRELEGVVYKYAATATTTGIPPHPSESESPRVPQAIISNGSPNPTPPPPAKEPPPIALLVSESAFTRHCLLAAHASPLPFLLVHLPPHPPPTTMGASSVTGGGGSGGSSAIGAIFGNPALVSAKGVLGGELEIRWERGGSIPSGVSSSQSSGMLGGAAGRPRLWWQGQPLPNWTPEVGGADVDGDGVVLNQR